MTQKLKNEEIYRKRERKSINTDHGIASEVRTMIVCNGCCATKNN